MEMICSESEKHDRDSFRSVREKRPRDDQRLIKLKVAKRSEGKKESSSSGKTIEDESEIENTPGRKEKGEERTRCTRFR